MNYQEAMTYMTELQSRKGSSYSLDSVRMLCAMAGRPDRSLRTVHIAGTNGKGSIGAFFSNILAEAGYTAGRYVSPVLSEYRERVQKVYRDPDCRGGTIRTELISEQETAETLTVLRKFAERMEEMGMQTPTAFEMETVMAFLVMQRWQVDVAVIECGMGGRTDATNLLETPLLCLFSHIGLDHTALLGDNILQIASEKYGILKPGADVVSVRQEAAADKLLRERCRKLSLSLVTADAGEAEEICYSRQGTSFRYHGSTFTLGQMGTYQIENALAAIEAARIIRTCGYADVTEQNIADALWKTRWPGRFECVSESPYVLIDGAHNPQAAKELRHSLEAYFPGETFTFICGVFRDKDYERILCYMLPLSVRVYTVTPPGVRGLAAEQLAAVVRRQGGRARACKTVAEALDDACRGKERTVVFGSLSFLHEVYAYFGNDNRQ